MPINNDQPYKGILPTVFKKLEPSDYKVNPFLAHKQFIFTSASATADDYIVSYASYIDNLPEISSSVPTTPNWPKNVDGSYHFSVYQSIDQLYYKRKEEPANVHGPSNLNRTKKHLYASASVISIPYKKLGDRVKLESFIFSGSISYSSSGASTEHWSYGEIKSDRYSNLYNTLVNTGSFPGGETFYEGFNEYHDVSNWKYTDYKLDAGTDLKGLTNSLTAGVPYNLRETGPGESLHFIGGDYFATPIRGYYNRNYDYAISLFVKHTGVGLQNQLIAGKLNTITDPKWPFALQLNTDLEINFSVKGATNFEAAITSSALTVNEWYHVLCQKTGSSLELYIDGTKQSSGSFSLLTSQRNTPFTSSATIDNTATLKVAGYDGYSYGLRGSLDEIRIFNKSLTQAQITSLSDRNEHGGMMQTNKVGNIFADQGIAVISFPYKAFNDTLSQPYTASYQSTVQLYEHSTLVRLTAGELNVSQNPTTLQDDNINIEPWATSSLFNPYITEIGLYNEAGQMLAFGKLANPIRKRDDIDMNFLVNIDIDM